MKLNPTQLAALSATEGHTRMVAGEFPAHDYAAALARAGVVLWSGLAFGIDAIAHEAAVDVEELRIGLAARGGGQAHPARQAQAGGRVVNAQAAFGKLLA